MQLVKYEAAVSALAACESVDEAKDWSDKAAAIQAYGRMSKNKGLEKMGAKIRIRALRRLGEVMEEERDSGSLSPGRPKKNGVSNTPLSLEARGIDKNTAKAARRMAAVPEEQFEGELTAWEERVSAEGARVSAKLEAAGEKELNEDPDAPTDYTDADRDAESAADFEAMSKIIDADDKLKAAFEELKTARRIHETTTKLYEEKSREVAVLTREASRWMRKAKKSAACQACMTALERE